MAKKTGDVLVVGAGISGIQASLDLANSGFKVILVDKAPAIGGHMAQFDKVFPTNDCSMCIESPKFIECDRHPNIEIITNTEIDRIEGEARNFQAILVKKPRYVTEDRCRGCGTCIKYCPVNTPDIFDERLSDTKAIHIHFAQAVPLVSYINPEACLFFLDRKCGICTGICENKAIDLNQRNERIDIEIGAIILSPGYRLFDPGIRGDYGYGRMKNVVTGLEFERILNSDGPYHGEILRPSDGKPPKKIAWIQCVGSRQVIQGGNSYCSSVCCMYAIKQMILAKEHDSGLEVALFHNDIRAHDKEFEQFYQRARELAGTRFVRSYVSVRNVLPESTVIPIRYTLDGSVQEEEFDMVVLSAGFVPPQDTGVFSERLGIDLNQHGFCRTNESDPLQTSRQGIFVSGAFRGPLSITESVMAGSGAAGLCGQLLSDRRGRLAREKEYPPEKNILKENPKVGVFVCHCGGNIGSVLDVPSIVQYSSSLKDVVHTEEMVFACSSDAAIKIADTIREKGLNRLVVAACTPRTHESLFQETLREAGINKYCFVMANIREQCSWVHSREKKRAVQKAKDKVRMAVARAVNLHPLKEAELSVNKKGLVIGGGVSGMISALSLANSGFEVYLVEKESDLGGMARRIHYTLEGMNVQAYLNDLIGRVRQNPLIHISTDSTIKETTGYVGNFVTKVASDGKIKEVHHGIAIIASGAEEHKPTEYLYGKDERVMTLLELEGRIAQGDEKIFKLTSIAMILCVGCRDESRVYCSRICCGQAIKCALKLKEVNPTIDIYVLYRDMRTYGFKEDYYREAALKEIKFIRYDPSDKPVLKAVGEKKENRLRLAVSDPILERKIALDVDIVALAAAVVPPADNKEISKLYKVPLNRDGFFLEAHLKLRPVDFATEGVFLGGLAHFPKTINEAIIQAHAAAGRAGTILSKDTIISSGIVSVVSETTCNGCGLCRKVCQFNAVESHDKPGGKKSRVNALVCQGCGACNSVCPTGAISINHFTDSQILAEIDCAFSVPTKEGHFEPKILAFLCNWCGYAGSDTAGVSRMQYAPNAREIRIMCSSRIQPKLITNAFLKGIDGVLICGCHLEDCHYIKANEQTEITIKVAKKALQKMGIDPERLRREYITAAEGAKYAERINDFTNYLTELGPIEIEEDEKKLIRNESRPPKK